VAKIIKKLNREFRHNRLALFDEMNVVDVRKHIKKLYKDAYKAIKKEFLNILNPLYEEIYDEALSLGFDGDLRDLDEGWIEEFFDEYNPTTKYVFKNEIDRKQSYLFESLVADPVSRHQSYTKAEKYLVRQVKQGGIDLEDAVAMRVYKDLGVTKVRWIAEDDYKTCGICNELDNQVFDIDDAPTKQHHNCRCYLIPVRD
jgi:SPP1 gp7 family putative phage head morphogenesis protein